MSVDLHTHFGPKAWTSVVRFHAQAKETKVTRFKFNSLATDLSGLFCARLNVVFHPNLDRENHSDQYNAPQDKD